MAFDMLSSTFVSEGFLISEVRIVSSGQRLPFFVSFPPVARSVMATLESYSGLAVC